MNDIFRKINFFTVEDDTSEKPLVYNSNNPRKINEFVIFIIILIILRNFGKFISCVFEIMNINRGIPINLYTSIYNAILSALMIFVMVLILCKKNVE